jgi:hypothetical protein
VPIADGLCVLVADGLRVRRRFIGYYILCLVITDPIALHAVE